MSKIAEWAADEISGKPLPADVVVIPEPLKARIITKGDARAYYAAMPLQKDSWRHLVAKEEFRLIGEPLSEEHLISIQEGTYKILKEAGVIDVSFDEWVSGDYSAATDGLSLLISQLAMKEYLLSRGIQPGDDLYYEIATKVLGAHLVRYDRDSSNGDPSSEDLPESFVMKNGQLMGSPLSFPVLCAINYVAYCTALKRFIIAKGGDWSRVSKMPLPVRVNGDDILFKANREFYNDYWKPSVEAIGFTLSPGKNYISGSFLTVNSEGWRPLKNGRFEKLGLPKYGSSLFGSEWHHASTAVSRGDALDRQIPRGSHGMCESQTDLR